MMKLGLLLLLLYSVLSVEIRSRNKNQQRLKTKQKNGMKSLQKIMNRMKVHSKQKQKSRCKHKQKSRSYKLYKMDSRIENLKKQLEVEIVNNNKVNPLLQSDTNPNKMIDQQPNLLTTKPFIGATNQVQMLNHGIQSQTQSQLTFKQGENQNQLNDRSDFPQRITEIKKDKPACATCILDKQMRQIHTLASQDAIEDADTQDSLKKESLLEKKLFEMAKKYAAQAKDEERLAKEAAAEEQVYTAQAQDARNKMARVENQAKQIALDALKTITIHPPHEAAGIPGMKITETDGRTSTTIARTPHYNLHVGQTDGSGFIDESQQKINSDIGKLKFRFKQQNNRQPNYDDLYRQAYLNKIKQDQQYQKQFDQFTYYNQLENKNQMNTMNEQNELQYQDKIKNQNQPTDSNQVDNNIQNKVDVSNQDQSVLNQALSQIQQNDQKIQKDNNAQDNQNDGFQNFLNQNLQQQLQRMSMQYPQS